MSYSEPVVLGPGKLPALSWALGVALSLVLGLTLWRVLNPFVEACAWAIVLSLMCWPIRQQLISKFGLAPGTVAAVLSLGVALGFLAAIFPLSLKLAAEVADLAKGLPRSAAETLSALERWPFLASYLSPYLSSDQQLQDLIESLRPHVLKAGEWMIQAAGGLANTILSSLASSLFTAVMMLLFAFCFLRSGDRLVADLRTILAAQPSGRWLRFLNIAEHTTRGVVYGAIVTALAQALLAGFGFIVAGAPLPALLGVITMVMSFIPFGAPMVYVPVAAYLILIGQPYHGIGLLAWGAAIVSTVDNLLRPLFIAQAIKLPLVIVFVGVIGGLLSYGLLGLFVGPAVVAMARAFWEELRTSSASTTYPPNTLTDSV